MRDRLHKALRDAAASGDKRRACTLRLIQTAIKDRDQASRARGGENIADEDIAALLSTMVKQRQASIEEYEGAGRVDEAEQERAEIAVIQEFLPAQIDETTMRTICQKVVTDIGARSLRDVGRAMSELKERYPGKMDFGRASCVVKGMLR